MAQPVPWRRVFAEGVAIVVSILLAFGIQAWWDGRRARANESELLAAMQQDLWNSRADLQRVLAGHERRARTLSDFLASDARRLRDLPTDSATRWIGDLAGVSTFQAYDATIRTADLTAIRDETVKRLLGRWVGGAENVERNGELLIGAVDRVQFLIGPEALMVLRRFERPPNAPSPSDILVDLRDDQDFLAARLTLAAHSTVDARDVELLLDVTDELIEALGGDPNHPD